MLLVRRLFPVVRRTRRIAAEPRDFSIELAVDETRVGIPMHQRVDLQLSLVEGVRRRLHHVPVDDLANPRVQRYLMEGNKHFRIFSQNKSSFIDRASNFDLRKIRLDYLRTNEKR